MHDGIPDSGDVLAEKYLIEHVIGQGGMGTVYAATHLLTEKRLAIKCLLPQHARETGSIERFMREARAAGRIQHRHVIDVFDVGSSQGVPFIVMPRLEGKPLTDLLQDEKLTLDQVLVVMLRAMEGVQAAHDVGIIHRDLKPCNIFVCKGVSGLLDDPRVLDFGISKDIDESSRRLTRSGSLMGTPYYMALEQLTGRRDIDHRVDIYSVGVILYEALAGIPPHSAENAAGLAIQIMHVGPKHLATLRADLPEGLADMVMRALSRDREDRFAHMASFISALSPYASSGNALAREPQAPRLRTPRDVTPREEGISKTTVPHTASPYPKSFAGAEAQGSKPPVALSRARKVQLFGGGAAGIVVAGLVVWGSLRTEGGAKPNPAPSGQPIDSASGVDVPAPTQFAAAPLARMPQERRAKEEALPANRPLPAAESAPAMRVPAVAAAPEPAGRRRKARATPSTPTPDAGNTQPTVEPAPQVPPPPVPRPNDLSPEQF